jgi:hypothetical protein
LLTARTPSVAALTEDFLIVCEGTGDVAFFKYLCEIRHIGGYCIEETGDGNSGFQRYFEGLLGRTDAGRLKGVIAVSDNDDSPDKSFEAVRSQLKKAKVPSPNNPLEIARWTTLPFSVTIMMIPFNGKGCLETLLLKAAVYHLPTVAACAREYSSCVGAVNWVSSGSIAKMQLRCMISAAWPDDPNLGLQYALKPERSLIPLGAACFDEIATELSRFPTRKV